MGGGGAERRTDPHVHHSPGSHLVASQETGAVGKAAAWVG